MSNQFMFADEPGQQTPNIPTENWKILIVDDEPEVHAVTKLALSDFNFLGRGLEFHSAFSGQEACELIEQHPDAAILLLDVVMETDDAGLKVARYIVSRHKIITPVLFCAPVSPARHRNAPSSSLTILTTISRRPN